jgi:hypothetical protein
MARRGLACTQRGKWTKSPAASLRCSSRDFRAPLLLAIAACVALLTVPAGASAQSSYTLPPTHATNQWYWEISPPANGLAGLPAVTGTYPAPGSANIWDTDMFADSNTNGGVPTGPSPVVQALHAAGKYSICYVEAGAQQAEPDSSNFALADYQTGSNPATTEMAGWPGEYWYDTRGFANYVAGNNSTLTGAAVNIAAGMAKRIGGCAVEGQDALEPDDLDGYTNPSQTGAAGGGWGLTQADAAGYERWLAYTAHSDGLAIFQKNDTANASVDEPLFDGMIIEECNYYNDPCSGSGGDATAYLAAGKPVLNAEYTQDGETTSKFCSADIKAGITGALFDVNLDGQTYQPCAPATTGQAPAPPPPPVEPANTALPLISGTTQQGDTLTATAGTWTGSAPISFSYLWSDGTNQSSDVLGAADVGKMISVTVTATNSAGSVSVTSAPVGPVTNPPPAATLAPVNVQLPALHGTATKGDTLNVGKGTWSNSPTSYSYQWQRCASGACSPISGATKSSYRLSSADVGARLDAIVTAKNSHGSTKATSAQSAVVSAKASLTRAQVTAQRLASQHRKVNRRPRRHRRPPPHRRKRKR